MMEQKDDKVTIEELVKDEIGAGDFSDFLEDLATIRASVFDFLSEREGVVREEISLYGRCEIEFLENDRLGINYTFSSWVLAPILALEFFREKNGEFYLKGWNVVKRVLPPDFKPEVEFHPFLKDAIRRAHYYSKFVKGAISPEYLRAQKKIATLPPKIPEREGREERYKPYSWKGASLADSFEGFVQSAKQLIDDWRYGQHHQCATDLELLVFGRTSPPMKSNKEKGDTDG